MTTKKNKQKVVYRIRAFNPHRFEMFTYNNAVYRDLKVVKKIVQRSIEEGMPATWEVLPVY